MDMYDEPAPDRFVHGGSGAPPFGEAWRRCCDRLRAEVGDAVFNSWFGSLTLESVGSGQARLSVPTRFLKSWIVTHYAGHVASALNAEVGPVGQILISVRSSTSLASLTNGSLPDCATFKMAAKPMEAQVDRVATDRRPPNRTLAASMVRDALTGSPLDRRLTFTTFQVGRSNELAFNAVQRVANPNRGGTPAFCPLYLHSAVGLGKTHLLQAVAHTAAQQGRSVIYLTAEKFMYGFVAALQSQTAIAFKERLRGIDLLIFDDAQFLQGKNIQAEFGHALNALLDAGREVIVAADRPPNDLESLDERIRSRLGVGLCVEIGALDEALAAEDFGGACRSSACGGAPFRRFAESSRLCRPRHSLERPRPRRRGQSAAGALHSTGPALTVETAETAIRDLIRTHELKRVKIEDIQKLVASHYSVSRADILSSRRTAAVVKPRQVAMFLAKILTLRSLPEIGRRFGGRDHTTVLHAVRKIEGLVQTDTILREELELLKRMLQE